MPGFSVLDFTLKSTAIALLKSLLAGECKQGSCSCWSLTTAEQKIYSTGKK